MYIGTIVPFVFIITNIDSSVQHTINVNNIYYYQRVLGALFLPPQFNNYNLLVTYYYLLLFLLGLLS